MGYFILDLDGFFNDVYKYVCYFEEVVIWILVDFGIEVGWEEGYIGVWFFEMDI